VRKSSSDVMTKYWRCFWWLRC